MRALRVSRSLETSTRPTSREEMAFSPNCRPEREMQPIRFGQTNIESAPPLITDYANILMRGLLSQRETEQKQEC